MGDHNSLQDAMLKCYFNLIADISRRVGVDLSADRRRVGSLLSQDPTGLTLLAFLEKHRKVLLDYARTDVVVAVDVKHTKDGVPVFLAALWECLRDQTLRSKAKRVTAFASLHQMFSLFRKVRVPSDTRPSLEQFVERQNAEKTIDYSLVDRIAEELDHAKFPDLTSVDELKPWVSTGATYAKTPVLDRLKAVQRCSLTKYGLGVIPSVEAAPRNRASCVPKDWRAPRVIFVEAAERMLLQQALRRWVEHTCSQTVGHRVDFKDQEYQRSSLRQDNRSSIDLSNASDELRSALMWRFLRNRPILRSALFSARSRECEIAELNRSVVLKCFGTMGNATTFTMMSLFLVCLTASVERLSRRVCQKVGVEIRPSTVFGDDIVCDDVIAGGVYMRLKAVGLVPSSSKTFIGARFKESCGLDLFEGLPVTPTYLKTVHCSGIEARKATIANHNSLIRAGWTETARGLREAFQLEHFPVNVDCEDSLVIPGRETQVGCAIYHSQEQRYLSPFYRPSKKRVSSRDDEAHLEYWYANTCRVRQAAERP